MFGVDSVLNAANSKRQKELANKQRSLEHNFSNEELINQAANINKGTDVQEANQLGGANDRGVYNSPIPVGDKALSEYVRNQKLDAIRRRMKFGNETYQNQQAGASLQDMINQSNA